MMSGMGLPMDMNLTWARFGPRVWNRTAGRARTLADAGATVPATPAEAARGEVTFDGAGTP